MNNNMEKWRQKLHIEPPDGWLNDPNGLSFFKGKYHVYFQYSPKSAEGKTLRCWGHYSGEKLTELKYDGIVLSPSLHEDKNGVYSGSAVEKDGILHIFYTGNVKEEGNYDYIRNGRGANVIHVSTADGHTMSEKQVILRNSDYPDFCSCHVRDPKVWYDENKWKMTLGARTLDDKGCALVYHSDDLKNWKYITAVSVPNFGYMWECPEYFEIDGKGFINISPQGLEHYETKFQNINQSGYFDMNGKLEDNNFGQFSEWDMGFDFYAPQSFQAPDGRRIMIAWMGMDNKAYGNATIDLGWQHCLTLPRELTIGKDGRLLQNPIKEITELRKNSTSLSDGEKANINLPFDLEGKITDSFEVIIDESLSICFNSEEKLLKLEFYNDKYGTGRTVRKAELTKCNDIRIIADMSSIEIYVNGGSVVMSTRFYPNNENVNVEIKGFNAKYYNL